jgi:acetyl esterase/lipase
MTLALASILSPTHAANEVVPLWPTGTKGIDPSISEATVFGVCINNIHYPTLTVFRPETPNGTAVVICPGGGYAVLSIEREGQAVARRLNADGITAFVLKYRLPRTPDADFLDPVPLSDALRAI